MTIACKDQVLLSDTHRNRRKAGNLRAFQLLAAEVTGDFCRFLEIGISGREMIAIETRSRWIPDTKQLERAG